ncbi:MAG TPA: hypothetical protein VL308_15345 [Gemmatimonadaceae bacterium]|jgi:hypothetical protein|nr:hypothetical protein [Gemmatimonadaceae bacterium]
MIRLRALPAVVTALTIVSATASAQAGLTSGVATVSLSAVKSPSLTVTVNSGGTQSINSITDGTTNDFPAAVNITTAWDVNPTAASVSLVGYFTTPTAALTNGTFNIPSSSMKGKVSTGGISGAPTAFTAFTSNAVGGVGTAGGSLTLLAETITGVNKSASRTFDLALQLDLTGQTTTPGTYTGTLNLRAVTQ